MYQQNIYMNVPARIFSCLKRILFCLFQCVAISTSGHRCLHLGLRAQLRSSLRSDTRENEPGEESEFAIKRNDRGMKPPGAISVGKGPVSWENRKMVHLDGGNRGKSNDTETFCWGSLLSSRAMGLVKQMRAHLEQPLGRVVSRGEPGGVGFFRAVFTVASERH